MVETFNAGANDYVVKPYSADQLEVRLRVASRRTEPTSRRFWRSARSVVSKRELAAQIWGDPYGGSERTVDVRLSAHG
jgi:DNA-binding response OmpR family regulator